MGAPGALTHAPDPKPLPHRSDEGYRRARYTAGHGIHFQASPHCNMNRVRPMWAFRGPNAAVNKLNNCTHPEKPKKNTSRIAPHAANANAKQYNLATPTQPHWHDNRKNQSHTRTCEANDP